MRLHFWFKIFVICFIGFSLYSCRCPSEQNFVYVSDLKIIHSGNVHKGVGIDKPYWTDKLIMCGVNYKKGLIIHPENGGRTAFVEFLLPEIGGRLSGIAGCAEETGNDHNRRMRFRIFIDGELICGQELKGNDCQNLNLDLGQGKVLRIESDDGNDGNYFDHMAFGDLQIIY